LKVLLAEDNPVNQEVALGLLEILNCAVTVVDDGQQAVDTATAETFDLVLMDCQMPVMDGLDATRAIRSTAAPDQHLPIVALTANNDDETKAACLAAGMDDLLGKPFTREALQSLLLRWEAPVPCPAAAEPDADAKTDPAPEHVQEPSPAAKTRVSSLDLQPIDALRALDPDGTNRLVDRAIGKFVTYSEELLDTLAEAISRDDISEISRIAHSLKSSSANLGAMDLSRACADLEKQCRGGIKPEDMNERLITLQTAQQTAKQDLLALIGN